MSNILHVSVAQSAHFSTLYFVFLIFSSIHTICTSLSGLALEIHQRLPTYLTLDGLLLLSHKAQLTGLEPAWLDGG